MVEERIADLTDDFEGVVNACEVVVIVFAAPEEEAFLARQQHRCALRVRLYELACDSERHQLLEAHGIELAVLKLAVGHVALEPAVDVVGLAPVGDHFALHASGVGAALRQVHIESHDGDPFWWLADCFPKAAEPIDPAALAGFLKRRKGGRLFLLWDIAAGHRVDVMLDERPVRAEKEQADVVESDGAISVVAVVLQPVDGETFELLSVQVLCRKRVGVPACCDGYENEGLFVLRHDAHGRGDVVCPGLLDDLVSPAVEERCRCLVLLLDEFFHDDLLVALGSALCLAL